MDLMSISSESYNRLSYVSDNIDSLNRQSPFLFKKDLKSQSDEINIFKENLKFYSERYRFYEDILHIEKQYKQCKNSDYILYYTLHIWTPLAISFNLMKKEQRFEAAFGNNILRFKY